MNRFGISVALLTPFSETGGIDTLALGAHAQRVVSEGAAGITLFGTTGEGASIGRQERITAIEAALGAGIPAAKITLGICSNAVEDAAEQVAVGRGFGIETFLLLPPFYFKDCADDGLFDWHMQLIAATDPAARFIVYHIPQVSGVGLSVDLVGRLASAAPDRFRAIKDSSGSWENAEALLRQKAMPVLVGDERLLHRAVALGADGSICGLANLYPNRMVQIFNSGIEDRALSDEVTEIVQRPVIPALKAIIADRRGEPGWERMRPPLTPLPPEERAALFSALSVGA